MGRVRRGQGVDVARSLVLRERGICYDNGRDLNTIDDTLEKRSMRIAWEWILFCLKYEQLSTPRVRLACQILNDLFLRFYRRQGYGQIFWPEASFLDRVSEKHGRAARQTIRYCTYIPKYPMHRLGRSLGGPPTKHISNQPASSPKRELSPIVCATGGLGLFFACTHNTLRICRGNMVSSRTVTAAAVVRLCAPKQLHAGLAVGMCEEFQVERTRQKRPQEEEEKKIHKTTGLYYQMKRCCRSSSFRNEMLGAGLHHSMSSGLGGGKPNY